MSFFFTLLDDSLRPKGSRDPLGLEHVWSQVGRQLVGNLTTVTWSLDNFIVALTGFYLAGAASEHPPEWQSFMRYEQILARARYRAGGALASGVLGSRQLAHKSDQDPVPLGSSKSARILSDQRQSGLWGLYSSALCATGLTNADRTPTTDGMKLAEEFLGALSKPRQRWLVAALTQDKVSLKEVAALGAELAAMIHARDPRDELCRTLLAGRPGTTCVKSQEELYKQAINYVKANPGGHDLRDFFTYLHGKSEVIGDFAGRVLQLESLLIVARRIFDEVLRSRSQNRSMKDVVKTVQRLGPWAHCRDLSMPKFHEIRNNPWQQRAAGIERLADAVGAAEWGLAIDAVLDHHAQVMKTRGGPPWAFREGDSIKVIFGSPTTNLPTDDELKNAGKEGWDNSYFVGSFLSILRQRVRTGVTP